MISQPCKMMFSLGSDLMGFATPANRYCMGPPGAIPGLNHRRMVGHDKLGVGLLENHHAEPPRGSPNRLAQRKYGPILAARLYIRRQRQVAIVGVPIERDRRVHEYLIELIGGHEVHVGWRMPALAALVVQAVPGGQHMPLTHQKARAMGASSHIHATNRTPRIVQSIDDNPTIIGGQRREGEEVRYPIDGQNSDGD